MTKDSTPIIPGTAVGHSQDFQAGKGTYIHNDLIYSSLLGYKMESAPTESDKRPVLSIINGKDSNTIPEVGSIVTCKVMKLLPKMAGVKILMVGSVPSSDEFPGIIRSQDVRATDKDRVEINSSFRPGDVVKAEVISLGDSKAYYLSTAKNELGVIIAQSPAGETMVPISWQEMQCPKTKVIEKRKCAKPL